MPPAAPVEGPARVPLVRVSLTRPSLARVRHLVALAAKAALAPAQALRRRLGLRLRRGHAASSGSELVVEPGMLLQPRPLRRRLVVALVVVDAALEVDQALLRVKLLA